ncbi:arsenic transporter [Acidovorax sp. Leaf160]|uniref:arsenic transporter n=1 Tax=Acidovorax sp. Leaf160 TaxID=1736280 RepID=UPI0006F203FD|nr:arsenic transporter [Acidovorax sp. Leaf160]KQR50470.1 arsenic transporter [Acidovorax sp. Leaf160]
MLSSNLTIWAIAAAVTAGVLIRPFRLPEAIWAVLGAALIFLLGLMPLREVMAAIAKGNDVYLFLIGMMLLSETARREGLFDWVASHAVNLAGGSQLRLFALIYAIGAVITTFLSNDATAVVLTPAVFAAARKARTPALPYLFICAFIANAASFVLPISNPANLVMYGEHVPALLPWIKSFGLPSLLAIGSTYACLRFALRREIAGRCEPRVDVSPLHAGGMTALGALVVTAIVLMTVSAQGIDLGLPTCIMGLLTTAAVLLRDRANPWPVVKDISWSVLPLVAGLFVVVEALHRTGVIDTLAGWLASGVQAHALATAAAASAAVALGSNVVNNLPAGLVASTVLHQAPPPQVVVDAMLIGVDLGPNLSITGSLATILWLSAIRREGDDVSFTRFLRLGIWVMPPALILAVGARLMIG